MNLQKLRSFVTIVELKSLTAAAEQLGIAQPALSRQVKALEDQLNVRLLVRHGRGVTPTHEGVQLANRAMLILEQIDALADGMSGDIRELSGSLTLALPPSVADVMAMHLIERTMQTFPKVNLRITSGFSGHVQDWLFRGKVDLGVVYEGVQPHSVKARPIIMEQLFLIQKPKSKGAVATPITRSEALREPLILPTPEHSLRKIVDIAAAAEGITMDVVLELDILPTTLACVQRDMGSTIYPMVSVFNEIRNGTLLARPIIDDPMTRRLVLVSSLNRPIMRLTDVYSDFVISEVHELSKTGDWPGQAL